MEGLSFEDFKKCFIPGHEIEIIKKNEKLTIWIFCYDDEIICNMYLNIDEPNEKYLGKYEFKPTNYTSFDNMVEDFFNEPFLDSKSINQIEKNLCVLFNTAGM